MKLRSVVLLAVVLVGLSVALWAGTGSGWIDIELGSQVTIAGQPGAQVSLDLGMALGRLGIESRSEFGVWPGFYTTEAIGLTYDLGRMDIGFSAGMFFAPFTFDTLSVGTMFGVIDVSPRSGAVQHLALQAGGDLAWSPYVGFRIVPALGAQAHVGNLELRVTSSADAALNLGLMAIYKLSRGRLPSEQLGGKGAGILDDSAEHNEPGIAFSIIAGIDARFPLSLGTPGGIELGVGVSVSIPSAPKTEQPALAPGISEEAKKPDDGTTEPATETPGEDDGPSAIVTSPAIDDEAPDADPQGYSPCAYTAGYSWHTLVTAVVEFSPWFPGSRRRAVERGTQKALEMAAPQLDSIIKEVNSLALEYESSCRGGCRAMVIPVQPQWPPRIEVAEYSRGKLNVTAIFEARVDLECYSAP